MRKSVAQLRGEMERLRGALAGPAFAEVWRHHLKTGEYPSHAETAEKVRDLRATLLAMEVASGSTRADAERACLPDRFGGGFTVTPDDWARAGIDPSSVPAFYPWEQ